jgi:hypothetical protein
MKILVETTGSFMLMDRLTRTLIPHDQPAEVELNPFIQERIDAGQLRVLEGDLPKPEAEAEETQPATEAEPESKTETVAEEAPKPRRQRNK